MSNPIIDRSARIIRIRVHAQDRFRMAPYRLQVPSKEFFTLLQRLFVEFEPTVCDALHAQNPHDTCAHVCLRGLTVERIGGVWIGLEPPVGQKIFKPLPHQAVKSIRSSFRRGLSCPSGIDDVEVGIRVAVKFVLQLGLPITQIGTGGNQMGFVLCGDNDAKRIEPGQAGCFALISCTIWAISKPMRS